MERFTWVKRPNINRATVHRVNAASWTPKPVEPILGIVGDQAPQRLKNAIVNELWASRGDRQTLTGFIKEIKIQEGLVDPR